MKYLLVLLFLIALGVLIYRRLRPHIMVARQVFGAVQQFRRMSAGADQTFPSAKKRERATAEVLARCASCGTWFPASRGLRVRASAAESFCSAACLESRAHTNAARISPNEV